MSDAKVLFVVNALSGGGADGSALSVFHEIQNQGKDINLIAIT